MHDGIIPTNNTHRHENVGLVVFGGVKICESAEDIFPFATEMKVVEEKEQEIADEVEVTVGV